MFVAVMEQKIRAKPGSDSSANQHDGLPASDNVPAVIRIQICHLDTLQFEGITSGKPGERSSSPVAPSINLTTCGVQASPPYFSRDSISICSARSASFRGTSRLRPSSVTNPRSLRHRLVVNPVLKVPFKITGAQSSNSLLLPELAAGAYPGNHLSNNTRNNQKGISRG